MRSFGEHVPPWPPLAGVAALAGAVVVAALAALLAAVPAAAIGGSRATPAPVLLAAVLVSGGVVVLVLRVAALTRPVTAAQLGLCAPGRPLRAALMGTGAALALAGAAGLWSVFGDPAAGLRVPAELDPRSQTARIYDLPVRGGVEAGPALVASALARCVLPVVAGEILLRGFVLPALAGWKGVVPAVAVVAVLFGGLSELAGAPAAGVLSILLGVLLCALYLATGSLLPGVAVAAAAAGTGLGAACALPAAGTALLALACALTATALAATPLAPRRTAAPVTA